MKANQGPPDDSAARLGQMVARGATFLFLSQIGSAVIGLLGSIILVRLLVSPSVYAPIGLAITVPGLVMLGDVTGVNTALSKFLSEYKHSKDSGAIWSTFWTGFIVKAVTGVTLSVIAYFAASPIAGLIGKSEVLPFFLVAAPLPLVWVTQVNVKSTLLALDAPRGYSLLQVLNEILLSASPILAVLMGLGALGALRYMIYANYIYLLVAYAYTLTVVLSATRKGQRKLDFARTVRRLMSFGAPLGFSNSFTNFTGQAVKLTIARYVSLDVYGLFSVANSASGFLSYVVDPIKEMLLPAYSRIAGLKDSKVLGLLCVQTTRYETAIVLPVALFFSVFAGPFVSSLYGPEYSGAGVMLMLIAVTFLSTGLGNDVLTPFLVSGGFTRFIGAVGIVTAVTSLVTAILVVPVFGLIGYLVASLLTFVPGYLLVVSKSRSALGLAPPIAQVRPFYYSVAFTGAISLACAFLPLPSIALVLIGLALIPPVFVTFSALFRAIEPADFDRLRVMISTQSLVPRLIGPLIDVSERLVRYIRREQVAGGGRSGDR